MESISLPRTWASPDDYTKLRTWFDGDDQFMFKPSIVAARLGRSDIPTEIRDQNGGIDAEVVKRFLKKKFPRANRFNPKCDCYRCEHHSHKYVGNCRCCRECRETVLILKWWTVIWEVWDEHKTATHIERDHGWPRGTVGYTVQQIRRALRGVRLDGRPRTGRPRGRPKKALQIPVAA